MGFIELFDLARRQHGVLTRRQAVASGVAERTFDRRVAVEAWRRLHRGVVAVPGSIPSHDQRTMAAVLAGGPDAVAARDSAAYLHGLLEPGPARVCLLLPHGRQVRIVGVDVRRTTTLVPDDVTRVRGIPATSIVRTLIDLAAAWEVPKLRAAAIDARQRRLVELREVVERLADLPQAAGRRRLLRIAEQLDPQTCDSVLVDIVLKRLRADGFRPDRKAAVVPVGAGRVLHPDITFAPYRVAIECDGLGFHGDRRALDLDQRKHNAYELADWRVLRIGWHRLESDWDGFAQEVREALGRPR